MKMEYRVFNLKKNRRFEQTAGRPIKLQILEMNVIQMNAVIPLMSFASS